MRVARGRINIVDGSIVHQQHREREREREKERRSDGERERYDKQ